MQRVVVIGGANVDIKGRARGAYVAGTSNPGDVTVSAGGVGRNIAENLARVGLSVSLVTAIGDDANGQMLRQACAAAGVDLGLALTSDAPTGSYLAVLDDTGELVSAINDMRAIETLTTQHLEGCADQLGSADMLVADCNLSQSCLTWLCEFSARSGVRLLIEPVSVPKARKLLSFRRPVPVFAITPNAQQLSALAGDGEGALGRLHDLGFANVVLHRGGEGAIASDGVAAVKVGPVAVAAIADVTGAGDAAVAGLVCGLLDGRPLAEAARLGQCAAAIKLSSAQSVASGLSRDSLFRLAGL
ncbi:carbohydrate kinase [Aestuariivirga litoralis]|uniref:Carbohydrate kinase n=1 Tax=Aestuariivirga litoralis TaxID=2650924 RepID=A0A2W2AQG1_9HYPH|nr:carbohydrate kinase family protein [Aestuariivirga litoralis]PZF77625.1 carbohydrate kinase [Aestuariivirga litoralis]